MLKVNRESTGCCGEVFVFFSSQPVLSTAARTSAKRDVGARHCCGTQQPFPFSPAPRFGNWLSAAVSPEHPGRMNEIRILRGSAPSSCSRSFPRNRAHRNEGTRERGLGRGTLGLWFPLPNKLHWRQGHRLPSCWMLKSKGGLPQL
jgi:hypothetical protein